MFFKILFPVLRNYVLFLVLNLLHVKVYVFYPLLDFQADLSCRFVYSHDGTLRSDVWYPQFFLWKGTTSLSGLRTILHVPRGLVNTLNDGTQIFPVRCIEVFVNKFRDLLVLLLQTAIPFHLPLSTLLRR